MNSEDNIKDNIKNNINNIKVIHNCPICKDVLEYFTNRYPNAICNKCASSEIIDSFGNPVSFANVDCTGGFISFHKINNTIVKKEEHICWIKGFKCYANEMRFGGIVIQTIEKKTL
jgi:hypothetical protein